MRRLRDAVSRVGDAEISSAFIDAAGHIRDAIDDEAFARALGRLQVAHVMGDMRDELRAAADDEEKSARGARAHRRLARWSPARRHTYIGWRSWPAMVPRWGAEAKPTPH